MSDKSVMRLLILLVLGMFAISVYLFTRDQTVPEGYVDSFYYCYEDDVELMVSDLFEVMNDNSIIANLELGEYIIYNETGYAGFPTLEIYDINNELLHQVDTWDVVIEYCQFGE